MIFKDIENIPDTIGNESKSPYAGSKHRSNMMLNPLNLKHLNRIDEYLADTVTLNLEDAIAPSRKNEALENIILFLSYCKESPNKIVVRVNPLDQGGIEEIKRLNSISFDAIRIPKVKTSDEIYRALEVLDEEKELHVSLETAVGFDNLSSWRDIPRLTTANLGILDLLSDLDLPHSLLEIGNKTVDYILSKFLVDAKTAGLLPVGFMYQEYNNINVYEQWQIYLHNIGYTSSACMGPKQVKIANLIHDPNQKEIEKARYIKEIFESNSAKNLNGFMDEKYGFIDEPVYKNALNILKNIE